MSTPPPLPPAPSSARDREHLRWLVLAHSLGGAVTIALCGLFFWQLSWMPDFASQPELFPKGVPPRLEGMFRLVRVLNVAFLAAGVGVGIATIVSGQLIRVRRARKFSLVVAALNGISVPVGTGLCVFTFLVLLRDSVCALYERPEERPAPR